MNKEGLRILRLEASNFKNITHKEVHFDGKSAIIIGANGKGKSSLIQAITSVVDSKTIPAKPIKQGEERAELEIDLAGTLHGEYMKYTIGLYFSPKDQKGRISIIDGDGAKVDGGKGFVSDLVGNVSFDMMEFLRMGKTSTGAVSVPGVRDQIEILKGLMSEDSLEELYILDQERKNAFEDRADINRDVKNMKARLEDHPYSQEELETFSKRKSTDEVSGKIDSITEAVETWNRADRAKDVYSKDIEVFDERIEEFKEAIKGFEKSRDITADNLEKTKAWIRKNPDKPSVGALTDELNSINDHNTTCDAVERLINDQKEVGKKELLSQDKTDRLSEIDKEKKAVFKESPLPVKGLEFDQEQILFKGLPLHDDQHPTSTLIGIGVKIGMAMNPNLRLLIIRDGSLLDKKTLKFILSLCEKEGYQVLIEMVDHEGKAEVEVQFTEAELV